MNIENIKKIFQEKKEVHFKMYSLDYTIIEKDNSVSIFADLYSGRTYQYKDIDELLNGYTIYNESIIENQDRIENIK